MTIRVSTIIPAFNSAATLRAAIDSALAQEFEGQEILVVNDGSTDGTRAIVAGYGDKIRVIEHTNRGFNRSRNAAIRIARGEYFAFLDAGDFWLTGRLALKRCVSALHFFSEPELYDRMLQPRNFRRMIRTGNSSADRQD